MDINSLRVFNILHDLTLSEQEFSDLEEEQKRIDRKGLYIRCVKKGYSICVSHDEKHSIIIKRIKGVTSTPSRILLKTLITFEVPDEIFILHNISHYKSLDAQIKRVAHNIEELRNIVIDRFIDDYSKAELGGYYETVHYYELHNYDDEKRLTYEDLKGKLVDVQMRAIFWLFGEDYSTFSKNVNVARNNISRIIKVFERKNRRLAIIQKIDDFERRRGGMMYNPVWYERVQGSHFVIRCFKPDHKKGKQSLYDYVDVNRELYIPSGDNGRVEVWLDDDLFEKTGYHELKVLSSRLEPDDENWILLNADEYNNKQTLLRMEVMSAQRRDEQQKAEQKLADRIVELWENGKLTRCGITFTKNSIEYEGIRVKNHLLGGFIERNNIHLQKEPEFDKIVRDFIIYILKFEVTYSNTYYNYSTPSYVCKFEGDETIQIGKVKLHIESRKNNIYVNNHRISKDDIAQIIFKALTYTSQDKFDEYLKYCASVNLTLQDALKEGWVSFKLIIDETGDNDLSRLEVPETELDYNYYPPIMRSVRNKIEVKLALPLKRVKNKNITVINGVEYQIKSIQALFDLRKEIDSVRIGYGGGGYLQRTIRLLNKAIKGISPHTIGEIVKNGTDEFHKLQEQLKIENDEKCRRADDFLTHAVQVSKAQKIKGGYKVRGISGKFYTINAELLQVHEVDGKDKRYVCLHDFGTDISTEWGRKDALAKRLLMLAHDLKVADEVDTLELDASDYWQNNNLVEATA